MHEQPLTCRENMTFMSSCSYIFLYIFIGVLMHEQLLMCRKTNDTHEQLLTWGYPCMSSYSCAEKITLMSSYSCAKKMTLMSNCSKKGVLMHMSSCSCAGKNGHEQLLMWGYSCMSSCS